jgi:hypothetical protein
MGEFTTFARMPYLPNDDPFIIIDDIYGGCESPLCWDRPDKKRNQMACGGQFKV